MNTINNFLTELRSLQQDGSASISAPKNWNAPPLLEIETPLDKEIDKLFRSLSEGTDSKKLWHFFIGAPGNGKSAAAGKLFRRLKDNDFEIVDEDGNDLERADSKSGPIPYVVHIRSAREGEHPKTIAWLAQDASVVQNPYDTDPDPAKSLIELLESAWKEAVTLIVCTNRGVLETAYRKHQRDSDKNKHGWYKALRHLKEQKKQDQLLSFPDAGSKFELSYSAVDKQSLLKVNDGSNLFTQLLKKATHEDQWTVCDKCEVRQFCPYRGNRDYLSSEEGLNSFNRLLRRAELYSGQIVVFREAVALVSLLLSGCSRDHSQDGPCEWVHKRVEESNYFALLSRKFYALLFFAYSPYGLERDADRCSEQKKWLSEIREKNLENNSTSQKALAHVVAEDTLSTDVGLTRLLDRNGVFSELDPMRSPLPQKFLDTWDIPSELLKAADSNVVSTLEHKCFEIWASIEKSVDEALDIVDKIRPLRRWITAYTFRMGAFASNQFRFSEQLDELLEILDLPEGSESFDDQVKVERFEEELQDLLQGDQSTSLQISDSVEIEGDWILEHVKPKLQQTSDSTHLGLTIRFGKGEAGNELTLDTPVFLWLQLLRQHNLSLVSFPTSLLDSAREAQVQSAAEAQYSLGDHKVTLKIRDPKSEKPAYEIKRLMNFMTRVSSLKDGAAQDQ